MSHVAQPIYNLYFAANNSIIIETLEQLHCRPWEEALLKDFKEREKATGEKLMKWTGCNPDGGYVLK